MSPAPRTADRLGGERQRLYSAAGGAVLLEVVLALVLFVAAATVITSGLSASVNQVDRLRLKVHASNLAATVLAEMQMGLLPIESSGPNAFDPPFEEWSWQAVVGPVPEAIGGLNILQQTEVVIRHKSQPTVFRLTQFLPPVMHVAAGTASPASANSSLEQEVPPTF